MMQSNSNSSSLLRRSLMGNSAFSTTSALLFLVFPQAVAQFIGLENPLILIGIGLSLLVFGFALLRNALRVEPNLMEAAAAIALDLAWVAGSVAILLVSLLNRQGNWAVGIVAEIVLAFAILQWMGVRRVKRESATLHQETVCG